MPDPNINPGAAVDLDQIRRAREAEKAVEAAEAERAAAVKVENWLRAMNRTFKGIMPRTTRMAMLERANDE